MTNRLRIALAAFFVFLLALLIPGRVGTVLSFAAAFVGIAGILIHNAKRTKP